MWVCVCVCLCKLGYVVETSYVFYVVDTDYVLMKHPVDARHHKS